MKIGIATFWNSRDNYGQLLQNFALSKYLQENGFEPFLILYHNKRKPYLIRRLKDVVHVVLNRKTHKLPNREFSVFREKHIVCSETYYGIKAISCNPPFADAFIVGSDQVWAVSLDEKDNLFYFLTFAKNIRKISYAASFGMDRYPDASKEHLKKLLSAFYAISVRENSGCKILSGIGIKSLKVLDPTFLIGRDVYDKLLEQIRVPNKYYFIYHVNIESLEDLMWDSLIQECHETRLIATVSGGRIPAKELLQDVEYLYPTVGQWLYLIKKSDVVITTSFHGLVYSIIFHRNFIVFLLKGSNSNQNNRIVELLTDLGLNSRIIRRKSDIKFCFTTNINWEDVDNRLLNMKSFSQNFLMSNLQNV